MFGGATISSLFFLGFLLVLCKSQLPITDHVHYNTQLDVKTKESELQCYDCNSEYDPRCGDPFDPYSLGIVNCSQRKTPEHLRDPLHMELAVEPVICRKTIQKVEGRTRVIRGCGYIKDPHDDKKCYRRTGTSAVEVIYCSCTKSLCNSGQSLQRPTFRIIVLIITATLTVTTTLLKGLP